MKTSKRAMLAFAAIFALSTSAMAGDKIGNCDVVGPKGSIPIAKPANAGELTVQVSLPAPVWWNGDSPENIKDGMEYCMAAEIAYRAGFDKVNVQSVGWDALIAAQTGNFDLALSEISVTDERKKVHDFSIPYFNSDIGVLVRADKVLDEKTIKTAKIAVMQATTGASFVADTLKIQTAQVYPDLGDMLAALRAGEVDAVMTDTAITLADEKESGGKTKVVGQYKTGEVYGAIYPKGNANNATLDKIMQAMIDDGTMKKLSQKYLADAWGKDPASIPYFTP